MCVCARNMRIFIKGERNYVRAYISLFYKPYKICYNNLFMMMMMMKMMMIIRIKYMRAHLVS